MAVTLLCLLAACATLPSSRVADRDAPEIATGLREGIASGEQDVSYWRAVAAAHPLAAEAGMAILRDGGTAVDAAVAVQAVLGLVEPQSSGIGGGAFLLLARNGRLSAWDGREVAPAGADERLFLDANAAPLPFTAAMASGRSVGVPGVLRMLEAAHRAHGRLPWAHLFQPAIRLANDGFAITPRLSSQIASDGWLRADPHARALFYDAAGHPHPAGYRLANPEYAEVLRRIAADGADALYHGAVAQAIVKAVHNHPAHAGALSLADLAAYTPVRRDAICLPWRTWQVCGMPPPSSGMLTIGQILRLSDLAAANSAAPATASQASHVEALHHYIEASRLAFADRDKFVADPAFVAAPGGAWTALWRDDYLQERVGLIGPRAMPAAAPGRLQGAMALAPDHSLEVPATSHFSIVDGRGQVLAMTTSIEAQFGSRIMVNTGQGRAGGFLLNNQLTDFSFVSHRDGAPVANRVAAGKRPRSSMAPTLVLDGRDGAPIATLGSPGGAAIIHYVAKVLQGTLVGRRSAQAAIDQPNIGPLSARANTPVLVERGAWPAPTLEALRARGHTLQEQDLPSGLQALMRVGGDRWSGGADRRREGVVIGD